MRTSITRRNFLRSSALGGAGLLILRDRRLVFAYEANSKLNVAGIGISGQGEGKAFSGFEIGGPLTELMQLVNLATLVEGPVEYDTVSGKVLNFKAASQLLHRDYRKGWSL